MRAFDLEAKDKVDVSPKSGAARPPPTITELGARPLLEEEKTLSAIVDAFNGRFGEEHTEAFVVLLRQVHDDLDGDEDIKDRLRNSSR